MKYGFFAALIVAVTTVLPSHAQQQVRITVENLQPNDGFYLTPVWVGFHNGNFDYFDAGANASAAVEALAEEGDASGLQGLFDAFGSGQSGLLTNANGFAGAPVLDPGESASLNFSLGANDRFLSFGSMIIPSNDGFFGNDNGMGIEVLDSMGNFTFAGPVEFSLAQLWDSGTELNNGLGAAFSAVGGSSTDEANAIALHGGLANFDGTATADGSVINFANASASPVLRISITAVPEPGSISVLALLSGLVFARRRRKI